MASFLDLTGERYGKVLVVARADNDKYGRARWLCVCECGGTMVAQSNNLRTGNSTSCGGCVEPKTTHGLTKTPLYGVWCTMRERCNNADHRDFHRYGGRGITVCDEWDDAETFIRWAKDNGYKPGLQLDRRDNDRGYSPYNCRFVTSKVNNRNRENNRRVLWEGEHRSIAELAELTGIGRSTLDWRIRKMGMPIEAAVSMPRDLVATRNWAKENL